MGQAVITPGCGTGAARAAAAARVRPGRPASGPRAAIASAPVQPRPAPGGRPPVRRQPGRSVSVNRVASGGQAKRTGV